MKRIRNGIEEYFKKKKKESNEYPKKSTLCLKIIECHEKGTAENMKKFWKLKIRFPKFRNL